MVSHRNLELGSVLLVCILGTTPFTQAMTIWEDTFETDDNWNLSSYTSSQGRFYNTTSTYVNITDGSLKMYDPDPNNNQFNWLGLANTQSTTAFGVWSFDFNPGIYYSDFVFAFAYDNPATNLDGMSQEEMEWSGYALITASTDAIRSFGPGFRLFRYVPDDSAIAVDLEDYALLSDITGWNHIDIIRTLEGNITVIFNGDPLFSYVDTTFDFSTKMEFANFAGNTQIDNLRVIDYEAVPITITETVTEVSTITETDITTTTVTEDKSPLLAWIVPLMLIPIIIRKRR